MLRPTIVSTFCLSAYFRLWSRGEDLCKGVIFAQFRGQQAEIKEAEVAGMCKSEQWERGEQHQNRALGFT